MQVCNTDSSFLNILLLFEGRRFGGRVGEGSSLYAVCCSSLWLAIICLLQPTYCALQTQWRLVRCTLYLSESDKSTCFASQISVLGFRVATMSAVSPSLVAQPEIKVKCCLCVRIVKAQLVREPKSKGVFVCISCRSRAAEYDIVGGDHLGCHFSSILHSTGLQYRDFIHVSFHNQVGISLVPRVGDTPLCC